MQKVQSIQIPERHSGFTYTYIYAYVGVGVYMWSDLVMHGLGAVTFPQAIQEREQSLVVLAERTPHGQSPQVDSGCKCICTLNRSGSGCA